MPDPSEEVHAQRGWMLKYSLGKSVFFGFKNWQRRYFRSSEHVLRYFENDSVMHSKGDVEWKDVIAVISRPTVDDHPAALVPGALYFALRVGKAASYKTFVLLLETPNEEERTQWVIHAMMKLKALGRFIEDATTRQCSHSAGGANRQGVRQRAWSGWRLSPQASPVTLPDDDVATSPIQQGLSRQASLVTLQQKKSKVILADDI